MGDLVTMFVWGTVGIGLYLGMQVAQAAARTAKEEHQRLLTLVQEFRQKSPEQVAAEVLAKMEKEGR